MARPLRYDHPGARHHVMNRGARRSPIFGKDEDCIAFLAVIADLPERFDVKVHAYALMPNHYHLMLESHRGNLSRAMQHVASEYTRLINARERWDGPMFRGRFTSRLVETDDYWTYLLFYLHQNATRAHLAPDADASRWSSHAAYATLEATPEWLTTTELLDAVGGVEAYRAALAEYRSGRRQPPPAWDGTALWRAPHAASVPAIQPNPVDLEAGLDEVVAVCGIPRADIVRPKRGPGGNVARRVAAWWLVVGCGATNVEAARAVGASSVLVCRWVREAASDADPVAAAWMRALQAIRKA